MKTHEWLRGRVNGQIFVYYSGINMKSNENIPTSFQFCVKQRSS